MWNNVRLSLPLLLKTHLSSEAGVKLGSGKLWFIVLDQLILYRWHINSGFLLKVHDSSHRHTVMCCNDVRLKSTLSTLIRVTCLAGSNGLGHSQGEMPLWRSSAWQSAGCGSLQRRRSASVNLLLPLQPRKRSPAAEALPGGTALTLDCYPVVTHTQLGPLPMCENVW